MAGELILIVEDNARSRKLARDVLEFKGYYTVETETGDEALQLARTPHPCRRDRRLRRDWAFNSNKCSAVFCAYAVRARRPRFDVCPEASTRPRGPL